MNKFDGLINAIGALSECVALFYNQLVKGGVPEAQAAIITSELFKQIAPTVE